jgi:DNA polymerase III subunit beta
MGPSRTLTVGKGAAVRCGSTHRALVEALNIVSMAVSARSPIPELRGVLVEAREGTVVLRSQDSEAAVTVRTDAQPGGGGRSLFAYAELKMILEAVAAGDTRTAVAAMPVGLADDVLTTPEFSMPLTSLPVRKYPAFPPAARRRVLVDGRTWFGQLARVLPAAPAEGGMPALAVVRFELRGDRLHMAASDRYRLAAAELPARPGRAGRSGADPEQPATALVPARVLTQITRRLEKYDGAVAVGMHTPRGHERPLVTLVIGSVEITVHGAAGTFPQPETLMPTGEGLAVEADRGAMVRAAKKVVALAKAKALGVHVITLGVRPDGRIALAPRLETARERARVRGIEVDAHTVSGDDTLGGSPLAVNGAFLLDALDAFSEDTLTLHIHGHRKPILLTDGHDPAGTGYRHLMMPVAAQ